MGHLETVVANGLLSDSEARATGVLANEVGLQDVKARRRARSVDVGPGRTVGEYVPFYFAPRSPMMFMIEKGGVATYQNGCDDLVYLVTTVETLIEQQLKVVFSDRNAVLSLARFTDNVRDLDDLIDWELMQAQYWYNTPDFPDRKERRMAECLVHDRVPWRAFTHVATRTKHTAERVQSVLGSVGATTPVIVRPSWYF
nr:DUF4433 domain-containing protein [Phytoactinopolyspora limicola]